MPSKRNILLALAFVATCIASFLDLPGSDSGSAEKALTPALTGSSTARPEPAPVALPSRRHYQSRTSALFAVRSWQPAPAPTPTALAPKAPALPFRYLGKQLDGNDITVFVDQGSRTHLLHKGDVLANYKVEEVTQADMTFVYLPLNEKQRLIFGSAN
jgi:hypothetical protein